IFSYENYSDFCSRFIKAVAEGAGAFIPDYNWKPGAEHTEGAVRYTVALSQDVARTEFKEIRTPFFY
ncbi:MAG: hypothetical protein Q9218_003888, partial [Villophora microphyllina]